MASALWPRPWGWPNEQRYGDLDTDFWLLDQSYVPITDQAGDILMLPL